MEIKLANTFTKKLIGLMFKKNINYGVLFLNTNKIHTCFMNINIDIYGLDKENKIIEIRKNIKPWKIIILNKSKHTLEIPTNLNYKLNIGDTIKI